MFVLSIHSLLITGRPVQVDEVAVDKGYLSYVIVRSRKTHSFKTDVVSTVEKRTDPATRIRSIYGISHWYRTVMFAQT